MTEIVGSSDAQFFIKIQYCGGWGYRPKCTSVIETLDSAQPNMFQYHLVRDAGKTGNFEVSIFHTADLSGHSHMIYSKKSSGKFPFADEEEWDSFMAALEHATSAHWWVYFTYLRMSTFTKGNIRPHVHLKSFS